MSGWWASAVVGAFFLGFILGAVAVLVIRHLYRRDRARKDADAERNFLNSMALLYGLDKGATREAIERIVRGHRDLEKRRVDHLGGEEAPITLFGRPIPDEWRRRMTMVPTGPGCWKTWLDGERISPKELYRRIYGPEQQEPRFVCELCDTEYGTAEEMKACLDGHVDDDLVELVER